MNHQVAIPSSFFLDEAKKEYFDVQTRLVQELLQNSVDAAATVIRMNFNDSGYSCEDNGWGMSRERMVSALLTMGGSQKEQGSTGGFGAAKKLLLFAHKEFSIHSNETKVKGAGLLYRFESCTPRVGTLIEASWADATTFKWTDVRARRLLQKCNFRGKVRVYINGELFTDYITVRHARSVPGLGEVYANKAFVSGANEVNVLHNGLFMFDRHIFDLNRVVVVEITAPSVEAFTQNRDGFRGDFRNKFDVLMTEFAIDKKSVIKPKQRKFVLQGIDSFVRFVAKEFFVTPDIQAAINQIRMSAVDCTTVELAEKVAEVVRSNPAATEQSKTTAENIVTYVRNQNVEVQSDFHFDLADSSFRKVPEKFVPNVGKPKYTMLAKMWKVCVREVLQANNLSQNFVLGFTFRTDAMATHSMKDGVSCYMINPLSDEVDSGTKEEKTMKLLTTAVHEVVHSQGCQYHDEVFMQTFHRLLVPTLTKGLTWRQIVKQAKIEVV